MTLIRTHGRDWTEVGRLTLDMQILCGSTREMQAAAEQAVARARAAFPGREVLLLRDAPAISQDLVMLVEGDVRQLLEAAQLQQSAPLSPDAKR